MFYLAEVEDHIRVEPKHFGLPTHESIEKQLDESYVSSISKDLGFVVSVISVEDVGDGIIIPGTIYSFNNGGYTITENIEPGKGYWVRANSFGPVFLGDN